MDFVREVLDLLDEVLQAAEDETLDAEYGDNTTALYGKEGGQ